MMRMKRSDRKDGFYAGLLFFLWPFFSVLAAFKNFRKSWAKNIFWAFCAFYGLTFVVDYDSGRDIVNYVESFEMLHTVDVSFDNYVEEKKDPVIPLISIILSRFTDSQPILTLVYGILFGFFFSRNLWYVMERLEGKLLPVTIILLCCLILINPIWNINGIRMWLAAHIFLYGLMPYLFDGKKGKLLVSFGSMFVHFSFLLPITILLVYMIGGNRLAIYYSFFVSTFFISELDLTFVNNILEVYAPESFQENTASYRIEEYVEEYRTEASDNNWYSTLYGSALKWSVMGFLSLFFFKNKKLFEENRYLLNLFCFTLLFYGVANLVSSLPSGGRFISIANFGAVSLIVLFLQNCAQQKMMRMYTWAVTPALLLYIIVSVRIGFLSTGATSILGNPIIAYFSWGEDFSLEQFLRMFI
jgi:hypothetical protein